MRFTVQTNIKAELPRIIEEQSNRVGRDLRRGMDEATEKLQQELRNQVRAAGLGQGIANAWRFVTYPADRHPSLRPAGLIFTRAPNIVAANERGGVIRAVNARYMAVPTEAGLAVMGGQRKSPQEALARLSRATVGRSGNRRAIKVDGVSLEIIPLQHENKARAAIVARGVTVGRAGVARPLTEGRRRQGQQEQMVVLFWLTPIVNLRKRLDVAGAVQQGEAQLARSLTNALQAGG